MSLAGKRVLLIVAGGIAAYKALELVRAAAPRGLRRHAACSPRAAAQFVTPLSLQALSEDRVYTDLFSLTDESEMGHIQLSRSADLVVVAPATADILAQAWRRAWRATWPPRCCWPPTSRCWWRRR